MLLLTEKKNSDIKIDYPEYTVALLHFDDENNIAKDECGNTWTVSGSPVRNTVGARFGTSAKFTGTQCLCLDNKISLGGQDFTIDFWTQLEGSGEFPAIFCMCVDTKYNKSTYPGIYVYYQKANNTRGLTFWYRDDIHSTFSNSLLCISNGFLFRHITIVYEHDISKFKIYVNGALIFNDNSVFSRTLFNYFRIGWFSYGSTSGIRDVDEFRVVDGVAVWKDNFRRPTEPYKLD